MRLGTGCRYTRPTVGGAFIRSNTLHISGSSSSHSHEVRCQSPPLQRCTRYILPNGSWNVEARYNTPAPYNYLAWYQAPLFRAVNSCPQILQSMSIGFFTWPFNLIDSHVGTRESCAFRHRWMDSSNCCFIPWHCGHLVRKRRHTSCYSRVCQVITYYLVSRTTLTCSQTDGETRWQVLSRDTCQLCQALRFDRICEFSAPTWLLLAHFILQIHTLCMDNAGNCNTTASELPSLLPHFRGTMSRTRCFPHILNLVAKVSPLFIFCYSSC